MSTLFFFNLAVNKLITDETQNIFYSIAEHLVKDVIQECNSEECSKRCYSKSAVTKNCYKYKRNVMVEQKNHTIKPHKTSKNQDRKLKAICLENRKCTIFSSEKKNYTINLNNLI